jgi:hypothetical protein
MAKKTATVRKSRKSAATGKKRKTATSRKARGSARSKSAKTPRETTPASAPGPAAIRAKVRMYRQGLGDCFLITLPRQSGAPFYLLIDCGVILGTSNATEIMTNVVQDIFDTTKGHIDVLAVTHEHWDHVSGFVQVIDLFRKFTVGEIWLGWTEDPNDKLAQSLRADHAAMREALGLAAMRMELARDHGGADEVTGMLEFFGARGSGTTSQAMENLKGLSGKIRYFNPATDAPVAFDGVAAKIYVLGPPHDLKKIKKINPSKADPETYGMADEQLVAKAKAVTAFLSSALRDPERAVPFDATFAIPLEFAKQMPFFQASYWGEAVDAMPQNQDWRRIDGDWLQSCSDMALALDSATNNTSLVLAVELLGNDVLLFAADAQVGNWLSWQDLRWTADGHDVTGPDLLDRTLLYKVGHHGSHNATLRDDGLEMMHHLKIALLPVDQEMAQKKRWGQMPFTDLLNRLDAVTGKFVVRIDQPVPQAYAAQVQSTDLFYEIAL